MIDICCNVNTINTKEGDDLKITMQIKLQPTKEEMALLDFTMQEYISLVNDILDSVSYTHLDVYKRQVFHVARRIRDAGTRII